MPAPPINPQLLLGLLRNFPGIAPINPSIFTPPILAAQRATLPRTTQQNRVDAAGRNHPGAPIPTLGETLGSVTPKSQPELTPSPLPYEYERNAPKIPGPPPWMAGPKPDLGTVGVPRDWQEIYAPDLAPPGGKVYNENGTTYVLDKEGRQIRKMEPGSVADAQAAGGQSPASMPQQKRGIWSTLTDPSLAGIALAAGQQMTRARYPGESGIGNAVNAVTAGYNTLAQQRQMQYARELAEREWQAKQAKAAQEKLESEAKVGDYKSQGERRKAQTEDEARKAKAAAQKASVDEMMDVAKHNVEKQKADTDQERVNNTKAYNDSIVRQADVRNNIAERNAITAAENLKLAQKRGASADELARLGLEVRQGQLRLNQAKEYRQSLEDTNDLEPYIRQGRMMVDLEDDQNERAYQAGTKRPVGPPRSVEERTIEKATRLKQAADAAKGQVTTAAPSTQTAPAAAPPRGTPNIMVNPKTGQRIMLDERTNQWVPAP